MMKSKQMLAFGMVAALGVAACGSDSDTEADTGSGDEPETTEAMEEGDAEAPTTDAMEEEGDAEAPTTDAMEEEGDAAAPIEDISVGLTYDIGGRGDQSFNDSAFAGIERAEAELGASYTDLVPNDDGSNRGELLQLQADENDLVIGVGFLFADEVVEAAANNPDTLFAVIDDAMLDFEQDPPVSRCADGNCAGLTFAEEQGSYLVGAAAALQSETGTIGFLGGVSGFGLIEKFEAGFQAGALAVDPEINIVTQYITAAPDFDGFTAPDRGKEIALSMYADGADVVYHAAGGSGSGLFEAALEQSESSGSKVWAIGVDSDQYNTVDAELQEYILTSMLKRVDNAVFEITEAAANGEFDGGNVVYDLSVDGVGYSTSGGFVDAYVDQLEELKAQIIDGTITVPTEPS
ncbi:MAG: BMP family ABC transporter substrate-binding protein [Ilumatobacter sp.]|uniref:BMP family lipoprotein n=1 Tax=Ilumatobacter sp. TaxID=1967498 RepID=UPI003C76700E